MTPYVDRGIGKTVINALKDMPVVIVMGMRQTGKTTFLRQQPVSKVPHFRRLRSTRSCKVGLTPHVSLLSLPYALSPKLFAPCP
jgi:hypothetical protein